jgi:hypothetical protein
MGEITLQLGEIYNKFLGGPRRFLLIHWLNSGLLYFQSSSSNMFFEIAKCLLKGRGVKVKFFNSHRLCFACTQKSVGV